MRICGKIQHSALGPGHPDAPAPGGISGEQTVPEIAAPTYLDPASLDPGLVNEDLAPVPLHRRTWGIYSYPSLWVAMSVCIPTYMLASGLIAVGMNWVQAIATILLGNLIVLIPM